MTTPPTPSRLRPCTRAISPRCWRAGGAQYTIYDPATRDRPDRRRALSRRPRSRATRFRPTAFDKVGVGNPRLLPDHRKEPGRRHRPQQLPGRRHRGKGQVLQRHLRASTRTSATGSASSSATAPTPATAPTTTTSITRSSATSSGSTRRPRCSITSSRFRPPWCLNTPLQLQPVHPRLRSARRRRSASISPQLGFSPQYVSQVPKDQARFPRINLTGYISNGSTNENRPMVNHTVSSTLTKSAGSAFHPHRL